MAERILPDDFQGWRDSKLLVGNPKTKCVAHIVEYKYENQDFDYYFEVRTPSKTEKFDRLKMALAAYNNLIS